MMAEKKTTESEGEADGEAKMTEAKKSETKDHGVKIVEAIYNNLFGLNSSGTDTLSTPDENRKKSCFQDGAFLFADENGSLFNYLLYLDRNGKENINAENITTIKGSKRFIFWRARLTHLMSKCGYRNMSVLVNNLRILKRRARERGITTDYSSRIVYHNSGNDSETFVQITGTGSPGDHSRVCQYERKIGPSININCGYEYIPKPKGVMKFYSYTILIYTGRAAVTNINPKNVKFKQRFTYVKLESSGVYQNPLEHARRVAEKKLGEKNHKAVPGENKTYDSETLKSKRGNKILCVMKGQGGTREAQNICYRAEDVIEKPNSTEYDDWVTAYNPEEKNNPDLQDYKLPDGTNITYKDLRVGAEYFVPQLYTNAVLNNLDSNEDGYRTVVIGGKRYRKTRKRRKKKRKRKTKKKRKRKKRKTRRRRS